MSCLGLAHFAKLWWYLTDLMFPLFDVVLKRHLTTKMLYIWTVKTEANFLCYLSFSSICCAAVTIQCGKEILSIHVRPQAGLYSIPPALMTRLLIQTSKVY